MSRRSATPSLEASQQQHIEDLVQQKRSLEFSVKKLEDQLAAEKGRAKTITTDLHAKWKTERQNWQSAVDELQSLHRLVQLRSADDLERERTNVLAEQEGMLMEKIARIRRDYNLSLFQAKESDLESRIEDLQAENQDLVDTQAIIISAVVGLITEQCGVLRDKQVQLHAAKQELSQLRETTAEQQVTTESTASKLERLQLKLDGALSQNHELERVNSELRRGNTELQRQLDKWQNLETKGGAEVETLRKQRIELEVKVKGLETELEKLEDDKNMVIEREKTKVRKLKASLEEWIAHGREKEEEVETLNEKIAQLENGRMRSQRKSPSPSVVQDTEEEIVPKKRGRPKKSSQPADETDNEHVSSKGPKTGAKRKRKTDAEPMQSESEHESVKRKPSSQRKTISSKPPSQSQDNLDAEALKPKKRKINLFSTAQDMSQGFTFGGGGGIIPSDLSPVKPSEVPPRSRLSQALTSRR